MENYLPKNRVTLVFSFLLVLVFAISYFIFLKLPYSGDSTGKITPSPVSSGSAPYFIPPTNTTKEVSVTGRVVKLDDREASELKATHKIVGSGGVVLSLAKTDDDKLKQQEGNSVTLVGNIPYNLKLEATTVLDVKYISFK